MTSQILAERLDSLLGEEKVTVMLVGIIYTFNILNTIGLLQF